MFENRPELFAQLPDEVARAELVTHYMPLAHSLARRYAGRGQEADDLNQVAVIALLHAIDRFDPGLGKAFTSFAVPTILGELKRHFRDSAWAVGVPRRMKDIWVSARQANEQLAQELGRSATVEEIADRVGCTPEEAAEAASMGTTFHADSLDGVEGEIGIGERLGSPDIEVELFDELDALAPILAERPAREREILYLRFFRDMNQREIAERVGMSQMNVSRILSSSLERLRCLLEV